MKKVLAVVALVASVTFVYAESSPFLEDEV